MSIRRRHRSVRGGVALAVVLVAATVPAATSGADDAAQRTVDVPGTYVDELGGAGSTVPPPGGVPLVVGAGTAIDGAPSQGGTLLITSLDDFQQYVQNPSPRLLSGVTAFFEEGGLSLNLQLTPDESATSLTAGLAAVPLHAGVTDLVVVPSIGALSTADHQQVATAADALAARVEAIVLLDPPDEVVAAASAVDGDRSALLAWADGLRAALSSPDDTMAFSSGLLDAQRQPVPAALAVAGLISATDRGAGVAAAVGGLDQPLPDLTPAWSVGNGELDTIEGAAVNSFRDVVGTGTVLWGNLTLDQTGTSGTPPSRTSLGERRVLVQIQQAMVLVTNSVAFQTNDEATWSQVVTTLTAYLDGLWAAGGLLGASAADAGSVAVGVPTTMTTDDILNGIMNVVVTAAIYEPGEYVTLSVQQEMQTS